jgi:hypothetical protein
MLQETGSELAIMRGALFTAKGALQTVQDYLESVDSDAPHLPGVTVDTIVKHALESADKALG